MSFEFPFKLTGKLTMMVRAQILVPRRGPNVFVLSLSFSFVFQEVRRSKGLCQECHAHPV